MSQWALNRELFGNDKDNLIQLSLERIERDEELEHVYELLAHVPRENLIEYLLCGIDEESLEKLVDQKIISATEARVWGDL